MHIKYSSMPVPNFSCEDEQFLARYLIFSLNINLTTFKNVFVWILIHLMHPLKLLFSFRHPTLQQSQKLTANQKKKVISIPDKHKPYPTLYSYC